MMYDNVACEIAQTFKGEFNKAKAEQVIKFLTDLFDGESFGAMTCSTLVAVAVLINMTAHEGLDKESGDLQQQLLTRGAALTLLAAAATVGATIQQTKVN